MEKIMRVGCPTLVGKAGEMCEREDLGREREIRWKESV